ncbi:voltage-gated chloride channel family protein [Bdellovibrio bacteriovorus]|uniref:voltage-gated chloride channel family protein n=1 Tax=Bdellovibrio bacteriovorus TaxID=959 RepID=UPI000AA1718F|nr:voltage-gated chloride channel family protein [Bdellovibrio bacteriovorus]
MFFERLKKALKWIFISCAVGALTGTASAFFLLSLEFITDTRLNHPWLLYLLPVAGLIIVFFYSRFGEKVEAGNNLILEQIHDPKEKIPLRMWPLIWGGTLLTHLCGGSAGREGTAVQMGGAIADQFTAVCKLTTTERKLLLMTGIAGGFASVFGTPWAAAIFGIEVLALGRIQYRGLGPCLMSAFTAHFVCLLWGARHTPYQNLVGLIPDFGFSALAFSAAVGVLFGLCAFIFSWSHHRLSALLKKKIPSISLRVVAGGLFIITLSLILNTHRYLGLGIPPLIESFQSPSPSYDFALKILFTVITLASGFKGGEVTPLFFIGATLGSALSLILPLPTGFLAALGFVAVFAGAANTPLACILMAMELFGADIGLYAALAIVVSYLCSGNRGIYHSQKLEVGKYA